MNPDGMVALLDFREDGVTPYMIFFKDGLEIEKCVSADLKSGQCAQICHWLFSISAKS